MLYMDASAIVKLAIHERESSALETHLDESSPETTSSSLARTEVLRAVRRAHGPSSEIRRAEEALDRIALVPVSAEVLEAAARLDPETLASLDSIHLTTALLLGRDIHGFVTYDKRLAAAARDAGLTVIAPSP